MSDEMRKHEDGKTERRNGEVNMKKTRKSIFKRFGNAKRGNKPNGRREEGQE